MAHQDTSAWTFKNSPVSPVRVVLDFGADGFLNVRISENWLSNYELAQELMMQIKATIEKAEANPKYPPENVEHHA